MSDVSNPGAAERGGSGWSPSVGHSPDDRAARGVPSLLRSFLHTGVFGVVSPGLSSSPGGPLHGTLQCPQGTQLSRAEQVIQERGALYNLIPSAFIVHVGRKALGPAQAQGGRNCAHPFGEQVKIL